MVHSRDRLDLSLEPLLGVRVVLPLVIEPLPGELRSHCMHAVRISDPDAVHDTETAFSDMTDHLELELTTRHHTKSSYLYACYANPP